MVSTRGSPEKSKKRGREKPQLVRPALAGPNLRNLQGRMTSTPKQGGTPPPLPDSPKSTPRKAKKAGAVKRKPPAAKKAKEDNKTPEKKQKGRRPAKKKAEESEKLTDVEAEIKTLTEKITLEEVLIKSLKETAANKKFEAIQNGPQRKAKTLRDAMNFLAQSHTLNYMSSLPQTDKPETRLEKVEQDLDLLAAATGTTILDVQKTALKNGRIRYNFSQQLFHLDDVADLQFKISFNSDKLMGHLDDMDCSVTDGIVNSFEHGREICNERENPAQLVVWLEQYREIVDGMTELLLGRTDKYDRKTVKPSYNKKTKSFHLSFLNPAGQTFFKINFKPVFKNKEFQTMVTVDTMDKGGDWLDQAVVKRVTDETLWPSEEFEKALDALCKSALKGG